MYLDADDLTIDEIDEYDVPNTYQAIRLYHTVKSDRFRTVGIITTNHGNHLLID